MRHRALYSFIATALVLAGALSIVNARQDPPQTPGMPLAVDEGPLVAPGEPPDFALIYTGGVVGYVEPCG